MQMKFMLFLLLIMEAKIFQAYPINEKGMNPLAYATGRPASPSLVVGFRGGINFSLPVVISRNDVIQNPDGTDVFKKDYAALFSNFGFQYAFMALVYLNESNSLSFEPGFSKYSYKYATSTEWTNGTNASDHIVYQADHRNSLSYLELPLILRHDFRGGKITPFLSLGVFYDFLVVAEKKTDISVVRNSGTTSIPYENTTSKSNNSGSFIHSRFGVTPGVGLFFPLGPVKFMLSADFNLGLNNIINESGRYGNAATTAGMYDIQDDMRLEVVSLHIGILFNAFGEQEGGKAVACPIFLRKKK
jgi:hypothetical protein